MIKYETGTTDEAEKFIAENISKIGKIKYVKHTRRRDKIDYITTFVGEVETIELIGGLTSGYDGKGPNGFVRVLESLGVEKQKAYDFVHEQSDKENHEFIIEI
ncbi:hypothetical protein [Lysinibacillus sp. RS5]|uniref:hypothetical protein n=1 Tax=unclassified Lysinibacillus TaxID=2636778 RepID=UPI0035BE34F1